MALGVEKKGWERKVGGLMNGKGVLEVRLIIFYLFLAPAFLSSQKFIFVVSLLVYILFSAYIDNKHLNRAQDAV